MEAYRGYVARIPRRLTCGVLMHNVPRVCAATLLGHCGEMWRSENHPMSTTPYLVTVDGGFSRFILVVDSCDSLLEDYVVLAREYPNEDQAPVGKFDADMESLGAGLVVKELDWHKTVERQVRELLN